MVTTLAAFRAAAKGQNTQPVSIVLRGTDGELYVSETDPLTGALLVTTGIGASAPATETTLISVALNTASLLTSVDQVEGYIDAVESILNTTYSKINDINVNLSAPTGIERVAVGTPHYRDYSGSNLAAGAWTQIVASTVARIRKLDIFDSSGSVVMVGVGGVGAEVEVLRITPGGNGPVELTIPIGSRISIQSVSGTLSVGLLVINMFS